MRLIIETALMFFGTYLFSQGQVPTQGISNTTQGTSPKENVVYLTPQQTVTDTIQVVGVEVQMNQPLYAQVYELITLSYIYQDGTKKVSERWIERVVDGKVVKSWRGKNFSNHFSFMVSRDQFENN